MQEVAQWEKEGHAPGSRRGLARPPIQHIDGSITSKRVTLSILKEHILDYADINILKYYRKGGHAKIVQDPTVIETGDLSLRRELTRLLSDANHPANWSTTSSH